MWAIAVIASGVGVVWPLLLLVLVVKRFRPKRGGPEFAPMMGAEEAEAMRRAMAKRAAEKVGAMRASKETK